MDDQEPNQNVASAKQAEPSEQSKVKENEEDKVIKQLQQTVEELKSRYQQEEEKANNYLTQMKYLQADFENYRKNVETKTSQRVAREKERIISGLLDLKDDLERAVESTTLEDNAVAKGVGMIFENLNNFFSQEGVEEISALGKTLDPNLHEAISYVNEGDHEDNTIVKEIRRGYTLNGKVIRTSLVEVAKRRVKRADKKEG